MEEGRGKMEEGRGKRCKILERGLSKLAKSLSKLAINGISFGGFEDFSYICRSNS
jgi:hypothetical protein